MNFECCPNAEFQENNKKFKV